MFSEDELELADFRYILHKLNCIVREAVAKNTEQLEREADWLADELASSFCLSRQVKYKKMCKGCELYGFGSPIEGETRGLMSNYIEQSKKCWREAARKATGDK